MRKFWVPISRRRLRRTVSFQAGRTTGAALPPVMACNWLRTLGNSFGACSVSMRIQSKPAPAMTSVTMLLQRLDQKPICGRLARRACLNLFGGSCIDYSSRFVIVGWAGKLSDEFDSIVLGIVAEELLGVGDVPVAAGVVGDAEE